MIGRRRQRGRRDDGRGPIVQFNRPRPPGSSWRWSAAVVVLIAIVIVIMVVLAVDHNVVVAVPVAVAAANPDTTNPDIDVFRDDHWASADVHRTGKCRHCQKWNKTKGKHSILGIRHDTLFGWGRSTSRCLLQCALETSKVCIGLTNTVPEASLKERGPAGARQIKDRLLA
jgi:hypothetical protein